MSSCLIACIFKFWMEFSDGNNLSGTIPTELAQMTVLEQLALCKFHHNQENLFFSLVMHFDWPIYFFLLEPHLFLCSSNTNQLLIQTLWVPFPMNLQSFYLRWDTFVLWVRTCVYAIAHYKLFVEINQCHEKILQRA